MNDKSEEFLKALYEDRLLVLLEDDDHKTFHQVLLDQEQFKKVSDAIIVEEKADETLKDEYNIARLNMGGISILAEQFDGMESISSKERLDAISEEDDEPLE